MSEEQKELGELRSRAAALEQLLAIYEQTVAEQSDKLQKQADELRRSNEALEQYAYVISHDLQEPLRMVVAYSELIAERYKGKLDEKADLYISFASGGARRMQELINALLDYSRIGSRGKALAATPLDACVDDALRNLTVALSEAQPELLRDPLPVVRADRIQITQLLQNLIGNTIKFRRPGARLQLRIAATREDGMARLAVSDNGIGIDPRYHQKIFVVFQRLAPKNVPGTGIGLSICQRIAERHGGRCWVESAPGQGSTFFVTLPLEEKP